MKPAESPLYTAAQIQARICELARDIERDFAGKELLLVPVLKGAMPFAADLMRRLRLPLAVDFVRARSYTGSESTGDVEFLITPGMPLEDRDVLMVEDILDTGLTAHKIRDHILRGNPASVTIVTLFDKPTRRQVRVDPTYTGFRIKGDFVVGYGMDYEERYRELPDVYVLEDHMQPPPAPRD